MKKSIQNKTPNQTRPRFFTLEMFAFTVTVFSGLVLVWNVLMPNNNVMLLCATGIIFTLSIVVVIRLLMDPDSVRARQSGAMLKLASQTLECIESKTNDSLSVQKRVKAQTICELLLPLTAAVAVAITDREKILAYVGHEAAAFPTGSAIRTRATHNTLNDGEVRILLTPEKIGFSNGPHGIRAAIIVPLTLGHNVEGTLKFYYRRASNVSETQRSIAEGFGQLLSVQMAAITLEEQEKLATNMELKMLQSQINPHFLFNTINTIASLVRTDPEMARKLLREFAVFYRRTLENSEDLITFEREMEQTRRYFSFEIARFGSDRVAMVEDIDPQINKMMIPPFLMQPLVENAVRHAMPSEGKLTITITGKEIGQDVVVCVDDDGVGMTQKVRDSIFRPESSTGLGIAIKNVHDRICGYFDAGTHMEIRSEVGVGTCIKLVFKGGKLKEYG